MEFTEQMRIIDDANLDPYQFRLIMHYWRTGRCWEKVRTTAERCNMSIGQVSKTRNWLLENGWIEWRVVQDKHGQERMAVVLCSLYEQTQQLDSGNGSPDEQNVHVMNEMFTEETKRSPDEQVQHEVVHDMNAILNEPSKELNEPKEEKKKDPPTPQKPKPKVKALPEYEIPTELDTPDFRDGFRDWLVFRRDDKKKPLSDMAAKKMLNRLLPYGPVWCVNRMETAIANGWQGLVFKDDIPGTSHSQNGHDPEKKKLPGQTEYGW